MVYVPYMRFEMVNLFRIVKYSSNGYNIRELEIQEINMVTGMRTRLHMQPSLERNSIVICAADETVMLTFIPR